MITQRRLRHVLSVAEHGHFGRAAETLRISQPALTKSIQALEAALGVRLFDRERGRVLLTPYGELAVQRGRELLHAEHELLRDIKLLAGLDAGVLNLALGPYASVLSGYPAVARLIAKHPKISVFVRIAERRALVTAIAKEEADLGLAELGIVSGDERFETNPVGEVRFRFCCRPRHPIFKLGRISLADLVKFAWVGTRGPSRIASAMPPSPIRAGRIDPYSGDFVPAIEVAEPLQLVDFIIGSDALLVMPLSVVDAELKARKISVVPVTGFSVQASYGFIYLKRRSLSPAALAYMQVIHDLQVEIVKREAKLARRYPDER